MRYLELNGVRFSKLVLGTDFFGDTIDPVLAFSLMDSYIAHGGNTLDTAHVYGAWTQPGLPISEIIIGLWLRSRGNRNDVLLSTKGGHFPWGRPDQPRLDEKSVLQDMDESLRMLQTDHVDIYWLHRDDVNRPVEDICVTLAKLVQSGKTRLIGVSNWRHERIEAFNRFARDNGYPQLSASQIQWSLAYTTPELQGDTTQFFMTPEELRWYQKTHMPAFGFSSQAKGFFAKGAHGLECLSERARHRYLNPENLGKLRRVMEISRAKGAEVPATVLAYITANPIPACAIFSSSTLAQMHESMRGCDLTLTEREIDYLLNGGEAPSPAHD